MSAFAVVLGLLSAWAVGTHVSLLTTRGSSMAPIFRGGDLAVTTTADEYRVGDIVAYRTEPYGIMVLHRIVKISGGRYTFKGDRNSFLDPVRPVRAKLVGKLAFRVEHAGFIVDWMTTRTRALLIIVGAFLLVAGGGAIRKPRKHRKRRRHQSRAPTAAPPVATAPPPADVPVSPPDPIPGPARARERAIPRVKPFDLREAAFIVGPPIAVLLVLLAFLVGAYSTPLTAPTTVKRPYTQKVAFDYSATAPKGVTYPDGVIRTGDPVFVKLVKMVDLQARYRFSARSRHHVTGTYSLDAELSSGPWKQTVSLQEATPFAGDGFETGTTLDLNEMMSVVASMTAETGTGGGAINIAVIPHVKAKGTVDGVPFNSSYNTPLKLTLDPQQLTAEGDKKGDASKLGSSTNSSVRTLGTKVRKMTFLSRTMTVGRGRVMSLIATLAALAWLVIAFRSYWRQRHRPKPEQIDHKFHSSMVQINNLPLSTNTVDVASMAMLARIAESGEMLILHYHRDGMHTYLVDDATTVYRFRIADDLGPDDLDPDDLDPEDRTPRPEPATPAATPVVAPVVAPAASPVTPVWAEPVAGENLPQSLAEAIRMRPITAEEIGQFGVSDSTDDEDETTQP